MSPDRTAPPDTLLPRLLTLYIPVMLLSLAVPATVGLTGGLLLGGAWVAALPTILTLVCAIHLFVLFEIGRKAAMRERDGFELALAPEQKVKLREFVIDVARRCDTPRPDDIRLSALSAAHAYQTKSGKRVLVIGGVALAALSQEALGAVVAHELTHFAGGDPAAPGDHLAGFSMMTRLGDEFRGRWGHLIDPAVWPLAAYHFLVELLHARRSRERELACDARSAAHAGVAPTAAALIYLHVVDEMPWANTMDVLAMTAGVGAASTDVFTEQARRAASAHPDVWRGATKDVLRKRTGLFDTHPCLKDRLDAIGATAKVGLAYLLARDSPPARALLEDWREVERKLSVKLTSAYQVWYENRYTWGALTSGDRDD